MLRFEPESHRYFYDGQRIPGVTQILKDLVNFDGVRADVLERKRCIGAALHRAIQLECVNDLDEASLHPDVAGYFNGWLKFLHESGFQLIACEQQVYSPKYKFAGTYDLLGTLASKETLIDVKVTATMNPVTAIQTAAYAQAANENGADIKARCGLLLLPNGDYRRHPFNDKTDLHIFTAMLSVFNFKLRHGLSEAA